SVTLPESSPETSASISSADSSAPSRFLTMISTGFGMFSGIIPRHSSRERIVKNAARGRPSGKFTQHRRLDRAREILERHPRGISLYELADGLGVTVRTMRRYLSEIGAEYELESIPTRGGGQLLWRIRPGEVPRKLELRRTQAY